VNEEPTSVTFHALGTTAVLVIGDPTRLDAARRLLEAEIAAIDVACSRFRDDSELGRLNRAGGAAVKVSPTLLGAVDVALNAAQATGGLVDPTIGTAMRVLGYDRDFALVSSTGPAVRIGLAAVPGWQTIEIDRPNRMIRVPAAVELDLGATAKAWCADRASTAIAAELNTGVLVSLGGDIAVAGPPPPEGWSIRICDDHAAGLDAPGPVVSIRSGGLATSSTTVRRWERGGERLHHVVDPSTGSPANSFWRTVSVAAATCVQANTATTASVILGSAAPRWIAERHLPARLVAAGGSVTFVGGWPADSETECSQ
jgi:thiamine biosynthesis lipoprotein